MSPESRVYTFLSGTGSSNALHIGLFYIDSNIQVLTTGKIDHPVYAFPQHKIVTEFPGLPCNWLDAHPFFIHMYFKPRHRTGFTILFRYMQTMHQACRDFI